MDWKQLLQLLSGVFALFGVAAIVFLPFSGLVTVPIVLVAIVVLLVTTYSTDNRGFRNL